MSGTSECPACLAETGTPLTTWDDALAAALAIGAFRYALGRRSFIVGDVTTAITDRLALFPATDLARMAEEIDVASHGLGDVQDRERWLRLRADIGAEWDRRKERGE